MNIDIFTLFPEIFDAYLKTSILGRALGKGLWSYNLINIRDYSEDRHKKVDDIPFGGGCGMVIRPDVIASAIDKNCDVKNTKFYYMSPRGAVFNQRKAAEILEYKNIAIVCGRYEGIDQRVIEEYNMEEISIGDFVLTGGELPALTLIDCCIRCLDGIVGNPESLDMESFGGLSDSEYTHLLEHPLYTQPRVWRSREVPDILVSGHHRNIENWKLAESEKITKERRPDMWERYKKMKG